MNNKSTNQGQFETDVTEIYHGLASLLISKHNDYGPSNIGNAPGGPLNGLLVRIHDKIARIHNLHYKNKTINHESLEDSFADLANYAIIGLMVLKGKWPKE